MSEFTDKVIINRHLPDLAKALRSEDTNKALEVMALIEEDILKGKYLKVVKDDSK